MDPIAQARTLIHTWIGQAGKAINDFTTPKTVHSFGKTAPQNTQPAPPASTGPKMWREAKNEVIRVSDLPQSSPPPTPNPTLDKGGFRFAYETLPRDEGWANGAGPRPNFTLKQPPSNIAQIIREIFPDEATAAAAVAGSENGRFEPGPTADNVWNKDGSIDRGIFAINSNTFNGLMSRQGGKLKEMGINNFESMYDPRKNAQVAKMIRAGSKQANPQTQGWGPWFGWQDVGFDLNNDYYSKSDRVNYELKQRGKK